MTQPEKIRIKLRVALLGMHYHVTVFAGPQGPSTLGNSGDLCFRAEHYDHFLEAMAVGCRAAGIPLAIEED